MLNVNFILILNVMNLQEVEAHHYQAHHYEGLEGHLWLVYYQAVWQVNCQMVQWDQNVHREVLILYNNNNQ